MACRRRETSDTNVSIFCYFFSSFWYLCLSLSHRENQGMLLPVSRDDATGQIWGLYRSGKQTKPDPVSHDDAAAQIWGLHRSGKQTKPDPALRPSSRYSDRHLCNGAREQCFLISLNQTSPTNLSLKLISEETISNVDRTTRKTEFLYQSNDILGHTSEKYRDDTSHDSRSGPTMDVGTIPLPPPSTLTPAPPAPARRSMPSTLTPASAPMFKQPLLGLTMGMATGETLILMDCFLGMGLAVPGPKRFRPRPVYEFKDSGPLSCLKPSPIIGDPNYYLQKPRSVLIYSLLNPSQVRSRFLETFARRLQMKQDGSLLLWLFKTSLRTLPLASPRIGYHLEEDWKKSQVDSKKILAQPHQSFKSLSFSFFPRSEISFVDDLAKKSRQVDDHRPIYVLVTLVFPL